MSESSGGHLDEVARQEAKAIVHRLSQLLTDVTGQASGFVVIWSGDNPRGGSRMGFGSNLKPKDVYLLMAEVIERIDTGSAETHSQVKDS